MTERRVADITSQVVLSRPLCSGCQEIMERSEDSYRGRVVSVYMMIMGLMPLGVLSAGFAADVIGIQTTVAILGVATLVIFTLLLLTQTRLRAIQ